LSALEVAQGKKKEQKYLTRFCQICRGFGHRTTDCWLQEKSKDHRPKAWKGLPLAQDIFEAAEQDIFDAAEEEEVEEAMSLSANPLPIGAGDYQGCE
jgi:hypothetical protein